MNHEPSIDLDALTDRQLAAYDALGLEQVDADATGRAARPRRAWPGTTDVPVTDVPVGAMVWDGDLAQFKAVIGSTAASSTPGMWWLVYSDGTTLVRSDTATVPVADDYELAVAWNDGGARPLPDVPGLDGGELTIPAIDAAATQVAHALASLATTRANTVERGDLADLPAIDRLHDQLIGIAGTLSDLRRTIAGSR